MSKGRLSPRGKLAAFFATALIAVCCGGSSPQQHEGAMPSSPSAIAPSPPDAAPSLDLPMHTGDGGVAAFGIWPFGVHGGDHAADGHPGWDLELRPGAMLLAPADGTVQSIREEASAGTYTLQIEHGATRFRTNYTNLASVAVTAGAQVVRGQPLGIPATISAFIGPRPVTYAMTHFQFDDFTHHEGQTNPFAVNPERVLSGRGRADFEHLWQTAAYDAELVEPFPGNPRDVGFPLRRTWTQETGGLAARLEFTRSQAVGTEYGYAFHDRSGNVVERGTARVDPRATPAAAIDLHISTGAIRRGVWDVVSARLRLDYGPPGAPRPTGLSGAALYVTAR